MMVKFHSFSFTGCSLHYSLPWFHICLVFYPLLPILPFICTFSCPFHFCSSQFCFQSLLFPCSPPEPRGILCGNSLVEKAQCQEGQECDSSKDEECDAGPHTPDDTDPCCDKYCRLRPGKQCRLVSRCKVCTKLFYAYICEQFLLRSMLTELNQKTCSVKVQFLSSQR